MRLTLEDWKNGWYGVEVGLERGDIDELIDLLQMIKADPEQHFHLSSDYKGSGGIGSVTFYQQPAEEESNATTSGRAYLPGEDVPEER